MKIILSFRNKARLVAKEFAQERDKRVSVDPDHPEKVYLLRKIFVLDKASSKACMITFQPPDVSRFEMSLYDGDEVILGLQSTSPQKTLTMPDALIRRKSTSGWDTVLGDKLVSWMQETKTCTACLQQSKYVSLSAKLCSVLWIVHSFQDYGFKLQQNTIV
ncbi:hypothetical protein Tco_0507736 [Tanacetum coccineum]